MRIFIVPLFLISFFAKAQTDDTYKGATPVGAFFLTIPADPRSFGMGNLTTISGDGYAGTSAYISYAPIATSISKNIHALNFTGHQAIGNDSFVGLNMQYFSLGEAKFYDEQAIESGSSILQEYAAGIFYAKKFGPNLSMGLTAKVIVSSLTAGREVNGVNAKPGLAFALDYGIYGETVSNILYGLTLSNIGTKITYSNNSHKGYLPMGLKLGGGYRHRINEDSYLLTGIELYKPLIPSSPVYDGAWNLEKGEHPIKSIPSAIFSSFSDSPSGLSGEIEEFGIGTGAELCFNGLFFARMGYFSQGKQINNGGYFTIGLGLIKEFSLNRLKIDLAYGVPSKANLALRGNFKIGLGFSFLKK